MRGGQPTSGGMDGLFSLPCVMKNSCILHPQRYSRLTRYFPKLVHRFVHTSSYYMLSSNSFSSWDWRYDAWRVGPMQILCSWAPGFPHLNLCIVYMWAGTSVMWWQILLGSANSCNSTIAMILVFGHGRICCKIDLALASLQGAIKVLLTLLGTLNAWCNITLLFSGNTELLLQWKCFHYICNI
jgi:hypothetical protein